MPLPLALLPSLFEAGVGLTQMIGGNDQLAGLKRPEFKTPKEALTALGLSKAEYADPRFAGQSELENQVDLNSANALATAQGRGAGMQTVGAIASAGNKAQQDITAEAARQQQADRFSYQNMLQLIAGYREKEFQMNEFAPYMDKYNEGRERIGAGQENVFGALDQMSTVMSRLLGAGQTDPLASAGAALQSSSHSKSMSAFDQYWASKFSQISKAI